MVIRAKTADVAGTALTQLSDLAVQSKFKNSLDNSNINVIGNSMKAQTPEDYKATSNPSLTAQAGLNDPMAAGGSLGRGPMVDSGLAGPGSSTLGGLSTTSLSATTTTGMDTGAAPGALPGSGGLSTTGKPSMKRVVANE